MVSPTGRVGRAQEWQVLSAGIVSSTWQRFSGSWSGAGLVLAIVVSHCSSAVWAEMKGFVIWGSLQKLINVKDILHSLCPLDSIAERGKVQKTLCSSGFKATWINSGFNKQKMDEMVHCFSLHICLRLSAVQKNDKLHQTKPVIGSRVFFLIFHFKKVAA